MIIILLMIMLLLPCLLGWGKLWNQLIGYQYCSSISEVLISGIFVLTIGFCLIAFFLPLNYYAELFSIGLGWSFFFKYKLYDQCLKLYKNHRYLWVVFLFFSLTGSFHPFILDHFGYYVPSINWLSEAGLVKGIANLDLVLGQMSFWHIFQAGFSHYSDTFLRINTLMICIYAIYGIERNNYLLLLFTPVLCLFIQSPSPDLPAIAVSLIILNEIILKNQNFSWLFGMAMMVFAIKPTMIWVPVFTFLYLLTHFKSLKHWWISIAVGGLFIIKNLWCFGYPFFPATFLDIGMPWIPDAEQMKTSAEIALLKTYDMQYTTAEIRNFSPFDFLINWFTVSGIKSVIHCLFLVSLIIFTVFVSRKNQKILWLLWASILVKSIFVVWFSAQYRFFIDVFFIILFIVLKDLMTRRWIIKFLSLSMLVLVAGLSFPNLIQTAVPSFRVGYFMGGFHSEQLLTPLHYESLKVKSYEIGNLKFNVPIGYPLLFDSPNPAITLGNLQKFYKRNTFPQLYGNTLNSGFYWRSLTPDERQKLEKIIQNLNHAEGNKKP